MDLTIEIERETDGCWLAEVLELAGVMAYGADRAEAVVRVQALALQVLADKLEHRELAPVPSVSFSQRPGERLLRDELNWRSDHE